MDKERQEAIYQRRLIREARAKLEAEKEQEMFNNIGKAIDKAVSIQERKKAQQQIKEAMEQVEFEKQQESEVKQNEME